MKRCLKWAVAVLPICVNALADSVWVEGEAAESKNVKIHGWYSSVKKDLLSGGNFLSHWGGSVGKAEYQVTVGENAKYALWLRANPVQAKLRVKIGDTKWLEPNLKGASHEQVNLASDNKPDLRFVAWVKAGEVTLAKGNLPVSIEFVSGNNHHGMLDCFCLTTDLDWKPSRDLRPGQKARHWQIQEITQKNLDRWIEFVWPSRQELGWRAVRWHRSLSEAAEEARKLERPILLWAMNGHPCGET